MLCEKCGRKINDGETFCSGCAKKRQSRENGTTADSRSAKGKFYSHSGRISPTLLIGIPILIVISVLLAFVYSYLVIYIPIFGYLNFLITPLFALSIGFASGITLYLCKSRNSLFSVFFGFLTGIIALYATWVSFEYIFINKSHDISFMKLAADPIGVWEIACKIAKTGWYSVKNAPVKGTMLWIYWGLEALLIVSGSVFMSYVFVSTSVFCELCGNWTKDHDKQLDFKYFSGDGLKERLIGHDFSFLNDITEAKDTDSEFYRITCTECSNCKKFFTLSLFRITKGLDKNGREREKKTFIFQNLLINQELFEQITGHMKPEPLENAEKSVANAKSAG